MPGASPDERLHLAFSALWLRDARRRPFAPWWALVGALLRPDHALFLALLGLVQLRQGKRAVLHAVGAGVVWVAWWCARWAYYGEFLPNTFHAKAAGTYWSQGAIFWADLALTTQRSSIVDAREHNHVLMTEGSGRAGR